MAGPGCCTIIIGKTRSDSALVLPVDVLGRVKEILQRLLCVGILGFHSGEGRLDTRQAKLFIRLRGSVDVLLFAVPLYLLTTVLNFGQTNCG